MKYERGWCPRHNLNIKEEPKLGIQKKSGWAPDWNPKETLIGTSMEQDLVPTQF